MQTYTHLLFGVAAGRLLLPSDTGGQLLAVAGSIAPDLVMIPSYALDVLRGRTPMKVQSPRLIALKELSHSLPFWVMAALVSAGLDWHYNLVFCLGVVFHILIDALTHVEIGPADPSLLWPLPINLVVYTGVWEYRYGPGILRPKPFEAGTCLMLILLALYA